jgi:hypothetical protein
VANSQDDSYSQHPDLLAAVILHTLVSEARDGMTVAAVAVACERDPDAECDIDEIVAALEILLGDGLAEREPTPLREPDAEHRPDSAQEHDVTGNLDAAPKPDTSPQSMYRPTRAAIRAHELSF